MDGLQIVLGGPMTGGLIRRLNNVLGRSEAAVTVPPLDGALRPNRKLDEAGWRLPLPRVDCLAVVSGELLSSAGNTVYVLTEGRVWRSRSQYDAEITCIAPVADGALAVALVSGEIILSGGSFTGRRFRAPENSRCITAMAASGPDIFVANGSAT